MKWRDCLSSINSFLFNLRERDLTENSCLVSHPGDSATTFVCSHPSGHLMHQVWYSLSCWLCFYLHQVFPSSEQKISCYVLHDVHHLVANFISLILNAGLCTVCFTRAYDANHLSETAEFLITHPRFIICAAHLVLLIIIWSKSKFWLAQLESFSMFMSFPRCVLYL